MKTVAKLCVLTALAVEIVFSGGCAKKDASSQKVIQSPGVRARLQPFAKAKEAQAQSLASAANMELPPEFGAFFSAAEDSDWESMSNNYFKIKELVNSDTRYHGTWWQPVVETYQ